MFNLADGHPMSSSAAPDLETPSNSSSSKWDPIEGMSLSRPEEITKRASKSRTRPSKSLWKEQEKGQRLSQAHPAAPSANPMIGVAMLPQQTQDPNHGVRIVSLDFICG